jgi:hypothetical protein
MWVASDDYFDIDNEKSVGQPYPLLHAVIVESAAARTSAITARRKSDLFISDSV